MSLDYSIPGSRVLEQGAVETLVELSVVMPCLNEQETVGICVRKAMASLSDAGIRSEVIVADNGSTDGSVEIAQPKAPEWSRGEKGYGNALKGGILAACGEFVLMADSDDSYNFSHIPLFLEQLRAGSDLVMGNRFRGGIEPQAMPFLHRYLGNPVLTGIGKLFFRSPCGDFHCGIRGFRQRQLPAHGYSFDRHGVRQRDGSESQPAADEGQRGAHHAFSRRAHRAPHLRTWRDGWRHLRFLLMYSPRWLFLYPGIVLMVVGWSDARYCCREGACSTASVLTCILSCMRSFPCYWAFNSSPLPPSPKFSPSPRACCPKDPRLNRVFRWVTLETGLIVGGLLMLLGMGGSIFAVSGWARESFGALDTEHTLRIVMPSVFALTMGVQITFSSFFLSILVGPQAPPMTLRRFLPVLLRR